MLCRFARRIFSRVLQQTKVPGASSFNNSAPHELLSGLPSLGQPFGAACSLDIPGSRSDSLLKAAQRCLVETLQQKFRARFRWRQRTCPQPADCRKVCDLVI